MKHATTETPAPGFRAARRLQLAIDPRTDPYRPRRRPRGDRVCPTCGLRYQEGRWQHGAAPPDTPQATCPACRRAEDGQPAGIVTITGPFAYDHRADVIATARHVADRIRAEHPLQRIMVIDELDDRLVITTTDLHLAQGIGRALQHAFRGRLHYGFAEDEYLLRVDWAA
jgi:hypothetical protein